MQDIQETNSIQQTSDGDVVSKEVATNPRGTPPRSSSAPACGGASWGAWREALGPPETVVGFTKYRKAKNGFGEWTKLVTQNGRDTCEPRTPHLTLLDCSKLCLG